MRAPAAGRRFAREPALTDLKDDGLPIPSAILPSTYTPMRRSMSFESPWARRIARKKSWWWASIPVALAVVCAVVLRIAGSRGTATASSAASASSAMEIAAPHGAESLKIR